LLVVLLSVVEAVDCSLLMPPHFLSSELLLLLKGCYVPLLFFSSVLSDLCLLVGCMLTPFVLELLRSGFASLFAASIVPSELEVSFN
jgi:hypothetical protein